MKYTNSHVVIPGLTRNLLSIWKVLPLAAVVVLLAACGDDSSDKTAGGTEEDAGIIAIENKTVSGVSQKGPFVNGSSVKLYEMDGETLAPTGKSFPGKIASDDGRFTIPSISLASQYALLEANGYFRNEITGGKSNGTITLNALTDLSDREKVNINLLTHLEYERSLYLVGTGVKVSEAKKLAESEILDAFEIKGEFENSEDLDIFSSGDGNAALLAFSVLMLGNLTEADLTERLTNFATDIERDGKWDDEKTKTIIADWASDMSLEGGLANIRKNIAGWKFSNDIPAFEKYVDNFWWQNYGLGICESKVEGVIAKNHNKISKTSGKLFICTEKKWEIYYGSIIQGLPCMSADTIYRNFYRYVCKEKKYEKDSSFTVNAERVGPVSQYGQLLAGQIDGVGHIYGACKGVSAGDEVQVRGMSLYWSVSKAGTVFYNESAIDNMVNGMKIEIIRLAIGTEENWGVGGFMKDPDAQRELIKNSVMAAVKNDIYVIIDWHSHTAVDQLEAAKQFFGEMAEAYGGYNNVIFEIFNEPTKQSWEQVRDYANQIVDTIRVHSDNLVLVGNPNWDQRPDMAISKEVKDPKHNVAYTFHYYAMTHGNWEMGNADKAMKAGLSVFVSEWGTGTADGNGTPGEVQNQEWQEWMNDNKISSVNWSASKNGDGASAFAQDATVDALIFTESGSLVKSYLEKNPAGYIQCMQ